MSLRRYSEYKHSGVEWLGEVPEHWTIQKFRHCFKESPEKIEDEVVGEMLSVSGYRGIEVKEYDDENRRRTDDELVGYRVVRPGQLVVNTMWLNYGGLGISDYEGHVSPAYRCYWVADNLDKRFVHHLMRSDQYVKGYTKYLTGIRPNSLQMSRENLMCFPILIPNLTEQYAIATFLDHETAKIDTLVAEQEALIALLKEKRQAVISHAVTKGIDANAPMKDSGIEWLGEVPEHWDISKMKDATSKIGSGKTPKGGSEVYTDFGVIFIRSQNVHFEGLRLNDVVYIDDETNREMSGTQVQKNDILLNITGASIGRCCVVPQDLPIANVNQHVCILRPITEKVVPKFLNYIVSSSVIQTQISLVNQGTSREGLNFQQAANLVFAYPKDVEEQHEIADFLDFEIAKLDSLTEEAERVINLLKERRSALISAAVTGKIDVRGLVVEVTE